MSITEPTAKDRDTAAYLVILIRSAPADTDSLRRHVAQCFAKARAAGAEAKNREWDIRAECKPAISRSIAAQIEGGIVPRTERDP